MAKTKIPTAAEVKEYLRQRDAVIEFLETHTPQLSTFTYDNIGYYYCIALISQSDYRQADCERLLWKAVKHNIEQFEQKAEWSSLDIGTLHRNMKVLEGDRPYLTPMKEKLAEYLADCD